MKGVRIFPAPADGPEYSASNPAPASAIHVVDDLPIPKVQKPGDILVQIKASTVVRDNLTWPELYAADSPAHLGNDFAGVVIAVHGQESDLKPGDEVYGMRNARYGGAWAEYVVVSNEEVSQKSERLSWAEAASLPLSAMTADQALFDHAGLEQTGTDRFKKRVLITGAAGAVGTFLVQLAVGAGHEVVAATSSNARNREYLLSLGVQHIMEYNEAFSLGEFDAINDTVGGSVLKQCWKVVKDGGALVSIDSASYNFVQGHTVEGIAKEGIHAKFFIVKPSKKSLQRISEAVRDGKLHATVAQVFPMIEAREAYELGNSRSAGRGKVVLEM